MGITPNDELVCGDLLEKILSDCLGAALETSFSEDTIRGDCVARSAGDIDVISSADNVLKGFSGDVLWGDSMGTHIGT